MLKNEHQKPQDEPAQPAARNAPEAESVERRHSARLPVIKSGKIIIGNSMSQGIFNCLVLDESESGVLVDLGMLLDLPEELRLQVGNGGTYLARKRWAVGTKAGLEFLGEPMVSEDVWVQMTKIAVQLKHQGVCAAAGTLRGVQFFDNAALRDAAEAAESAYLRLEALLTNR